MQSYNERRPQSCQCVQDFKNTKKNAHPSLRIKKSQLIWNVVVLGYCQMRMSSNSFPLFSSSFETWGPRTAATTPPETTAMCVPPATTGRWRARPATALSAPVLTASLPGEPCRCAGTPAPPTAEGGLLPLSASLSRVSAWSVLMNTLCLSRKANFKKKCSFFQHLRRIFSKAKYLCVSFEC